jgi:hypothetical protein
MQSADLDHDGTVDEAEFVLFKLRQMGVVNEEDISLCRQLFRHMDQNHDGTLSEDELLNPEQEFAVVHTPHKTGASLSDPPAAAASDGNGSNPGFATPRVV